MDIIGTLIIGGVAGWLAGLLLKGSGYGILLDIVVGVIGGFIGGWLASLSHIGFLNEASASKGVVAIVVELILAVVGAVILLSVIRLVKKVL